MAQILAPTSAQAGANNPTTAIQQFRAGAQPAIEDPLTNLLHVTTFITAESPIVALTVRELFRLEKGSIVSTSQLLGANVSLLVGGRLLAWGEFQVAGERLAMRIAELA
jgi:flagellar motor switch/type III secretory pathway protein FliN